MVVEKGGMIVWSLVVVQSGVVSVQGSAVYYHSQGTAVVAPWDNHGVEEGDSLAEKDNSDEPEEGSHMKDLLQKHS